MSTASSGVGQKKIISDEISLNANAVKVRSVMELKSPQDLWMRVVETAQRIGISDMLVISAAKLPKKFEICVIPAGLITDANWSDFEERHLNASIYVASATDCLVKATMPLGFTPIEELPDLIVIGCPHVDPAFMNSLKEQLIQMGLRV